MITDAAPSADEQLRSRRRNYTLLMAIHLVGLAVGGALYEQAWGLGLAILIITGPLPWVAVILANAAPRRRLRSNRTGGGHPPASPPSIRPGQVSGYSARSGIEAAGTEDTHRI